MTRTKQDKTGQPEAPRELEPAQLSALAALLAGATDEEASAAAGVARSTLSRWKASDDVFIAALNAALRDAWEEQAGRLYALRSRAVAIIGQALDSDDEKLKVATAWKLLETLSAPTGPTTPAGVENERANRVLADALGML